MADGVLASILEGPHTWGRVQIGPGTISVFKCLVCKATVHRDAPPGLACTGRYVTADGVALPIVPGCDGAPRQEEAKEP